MTRPIPKRIALRHTVAALLVGLAFCLAVGSAAEFEVTTDVDFIDMTHYSGVPLDETWCDRIFADCQRTGIRRVYWRVALGRAYYRSKIMGRVSAEGNTEKRIIEFARVLDGDGPEPLELAVKSAHRHGVQLIAWFPFNEAYYLHPGTRNLTDPWYAERQDLFWSDRQGKRVWMGMPCVAEPEVVARTASIIEELCGYGVDGVYLSNRTHCYRPWASGQQAYDVETDQFGYNEPIQRRFKKRYGIDIRTEDFNRDDWHLVKGEFYTEFLAACAEAAHSHGKVLLASTLAQRFAYAPSAAYPSALRIYNDWGAWHKQAKVDGIVSVQVRVRLPAGAQSVPQDKIEATTVDIQPILSAAPDCPVHIFHPILVFRPAGGGSWSLQDRIIEPVEMLDQRVRIAHAAGATSLILHEGYVPLMLDTAGQDIGVGATPKEGYWKAVGKWNR